MATLNFAVQLHVTTRTVYLNGAEVEAEYGIEIAENDVVEIEETFETDYFNTFQGISYIADGNSVTPPTTTTTTEGTTVTTQFTVDATFANYVDIIRRVNYDTTNMHTVSISFTNGANTDYEYFYYTEDSATEESDNVYLDGSTVQIYCTTKYYHNQNNQVPKFKEITSATGLNASDITYTSMGVETGNEDFAYIETGIISFTMPSANVSFTADFEDGTVVTVTFDAKGGSSVDTQYVIAGNKLNTSLIYTSKDDYILYGWSTTENVHTGFDIYDDVVTETMTLYATWAFGITFEFNGGVMGTSQATYARYPVNPNTGLVDRIPELTKEGYTFTGWKLSDEVTYTTAELAEVVFNSNATLTAQWVGGSGSKTVTFNEGDDTVATLEVESGELIYPIAPAHLTDASGNEFIYWTLNNTEFDFSTPITEDTTLVALYVKGGSDKWIMSLPNCFVGMKSDIADLPKSRVADGTKALAISETSGEETAYIFHRASLTWVELQHYTVMI